DLEDHVAGIIGIAGGEQVLEVLALLLEALAQLCRLAGQLLVPLPQGLELVDGLEIRCGRLEARGRVEDALELAVAPAHPPGAGRVLVQGGVGHRLLEGGVRPAQRGEAVAPVVCAHGCFSLRRSIATVPLPRSSLCRWVNAPRCD